MIIRGNDCIFNSDIELEVVQGSLVLTQDDNTITIEDDEVKKLAQFVVDKNERELHLIGSNILASVNLFANKDGNSHKLILETGETSILTYNVIRLSGSMYDQLLNHLANMGIL